MLGLSPATAFQILFVCVLPICAWVAWSDLKTMKIPNKAVIALMAVYAVVGFLVIPFEPWAWRWVNFIVILAIGFVLNAVANVGAGDAKFAAAAAPFIKASHAGFVLPLFAAFLLGAFAAHRLLRAIPAIRRMTPDWVSWTRKDFPMGLALVGTFLTYLALAAFPSVYAAFQGALASIRI
ncbi:MAG: prepilin peptidase [Rhodobacteraceae bacterium]|nr:prepilin peptidase [Paracoccaceae bacterium]